MSAYQEAIATAIEDLGITTPIFRGMVPSDPDAVIGVFETGGLEPENDKVSWRGQPTFQILTRAPALDRQIASDQAALLLASLHRADVAGFRMFRAQQSTPTSLALDDRNRPRFVVNFRGIAASA